jgi:aryl-alcohol dehydrogenase-like predicted oxidoreductase
MGLGAMTWGQPTGWARWTPAQLSYGPSHGTAEEEQALAASLAAGVNLVDTAEMYSAGASEKRVGELAAGKAVIVATKFPPSPFARTEAFPRALAASLARLGRIDLYQHHFPSGRVSIPALMNLMADAVEAGQVRAIGVSNYSAAQMRLAHETLAKRGLPLASNQVEYSLLHRKPEVDGVLDACRELGITLIAFSPLAMGALTGKYGAGQQRPGGFFRGMLPSFGRRAMEAVAPVVARLREIGQRYGKSPSQVALRWLIENDSVLPIPGAKNARQAAQNAEALAFRLTPDEVETLSAATLAWRK